MTAKREVPVYLAYKRGRAVWTAQQSRAWPIIDITSRGPLILLEHLR
jgi:hypothetical protein